MAMESTFAVDSSVHKATPPGHSWQSYVKQPLIGCACGILGRLIDFPFDTIKTRLQTASLASLQARLAAKIPGAPVLPIPTATMESPLQCLRNTINKEGFRGLYRGCITPCMGAAVEDSITFSVYHAAVRYFGRQSRGDGGGVSGGGGGRARPEDLPLSRVFLAGSMGGMTTSFIVTPLELIKCRLQVDRVSKEGMGGSVARYKGPIDCLLQSVRQEGIRVLYRGHSATFLRESLGTGVFFSTYEMGLRTLAAGIPREEVPAPAVLLAGAMAGVVLNAVPYPLDTAKSVMQTLQAPVGAGEGGAAVVPRSLWGAVKLIVEAEGVAGLYRGITPALLRAMPSNAVVFLSYETLNRLLRDWGD